MKKLRVTLNGKIYDLTVEVLEDDEQYVTGSNMPSALPSPSASRRKVVETPATPAAPPPPPSGAARQGGKIDPDTILAPIAGTVQKVFVQAGTHVEEKTPVVMLDAMKMDTYIYAPRGGDVAEVCVQPGDSVQVGTCLIRYRAGA